MNLERRQLDPESRAAIRTRLANWLAARPEVRFAVVHGSFAAPSAFRDIDVAVWVDPAMAPSGRALDVELDLAGETERLIGLPVDIKLLNWAGLGFRYAASGGELLFARHRDEWFDFRERTWQEYFDFLPFLKASLHDVCTR